MNKKLYPDSSVQGSIFETWSSNYFMVAFSLRPPTLSCTTNKHRG